MPNAGIKIAAATVAPSQSVQLKARTAAASVVAPALPSRMRLPRWRYWQRNLPLASTQKGNLFQDLNNNAIHWYLPSFALNDDPDAQFTFAASQTGVDGSGKPFNTATLSIGLKKLVPPDIAAFKAANLSVDLREIPLHGIAATLSISYKSADSGIDKYYSYPGAVHAGDDGSLQVTLSNCIGPSVIVLYHNLRAGGATLAISATYDAWLHKPTPSPQGAPTPVRTIALPARAMSATVTRINPSLAVARSAMMIRTLPPAQAAATPGSAQPQYVLGVLPFGLSVPLVKKYAADVYQLKYTITENGVARTIINVDDLNQFNAKQSEFTELKSLGDINARYPSLGRLYLGTLSRTIVVLPTRYAIVRGIDSCAAACTALVDSSPVDASACKFQFGFILAPDVSAVEMIELSLEVAQHPELADCKLKFPDFLNDKLASTLFTSFVSSVQFANGADPHTVALTVEIKDAPSGTPASANANLFIKQLCSANEPFLSGTLNFKLDDTYSGTVNSALVLNFKMTSGAEKLTDNGAGGLAYSIDETAQHIQLANNASFDFLLLRYALATDKSVQVLPLASTLKGGQTLSLPLPSDHAHLNVLIDYELAVPERLLSADLGRYLQFQTQDVQNVQYTIGVNVANVNFSSRGVARLDARVSLMDLAQIDVPVLSLNKLVKLASTNIRLPIQNAINSLKATVLFTIQYTDPQKANLQFSLQCDFNDTPIYVLHDSDVPGVALTPG